MPASELELIPPDFRFVPLYHQFCADRAMLTILRFYREPESNQPLPPKTSLRVVIATVDLDVGESLPLILQALRQVVGFQIAIVCVALPD